MSVAVALRVAHFMLPNLQQRQFEVRRFHETLVTARFAMGPAELSRENAASPFNTNQATAPLRRLAPLSTRENAGRSASGPVIP